MKKFWALLVLSGLVFNIQARDLDHGRYTSKSKRGKTAKMTRKLTRAQWNKKYHWTPFIVAAASNDVQKMTRLYKKNKNVVNQTTSDGGTSFMEAARNNALGSLQWFKNNGLLKKVINEQDKTFGNTALIETAFEGSRATLAYQWLIKNGADTELKNKAGDTALSVKNGLALIHASMLGDLDEVERLLKTKPAKNLRDSSGNTALLNACMNGTQFSKNIDTYVEIAHVLIKAGAEVNVVGSHRMTPLLWAVMNNNSDVVQMLLKKGADVNVVNYQGYTPLALAVLGPCPQALNILLMDGKIALDKNFLLLYGKITKKYLKGLNSHPPAQFEEAHQMKMLALKEVVLYLREYKDRFPHGDYLNDCTKCTMDESNITCYCRSHNGKIRKSTIRTNIKDHESIEVNKHGILEKATEEDKQAKKTKTVTKTSRTALFTSSKKPKSDNQSSTNRTDFRNMFTNVDF